MRDHFTSLQRNYGNISVMSVHHFVPGGSHVTIIKDALDLTVQVPTYTVPGPIFHCTGPWRWLLSPCTGSPICTGPWPLCTRFQLQHTHPHPRPQTEDLFKLVHLRTSLYGPPIWWMPTQPHTMDKRTVSIPLEYLFVIILSLKELLD